jgi:WD40-like Beta Propeller Repeat
LLAVLAILPIHPRSSSAECTEFGPITLPNVIWGLKDSVSACPAGDTLLFSGNSHPSRLRIGVHYEDASCNVRVGVPPESIWVTYFTISGNLKVNDKGVKVFADDSTDGGGNARITMASFSGCGRMSVKLYVAGVEQGTKLAFVRTTDPDADGRTTTADLSSLCDINYDGVVDGLEASCVYDHIEHWHRNALHGTLVRRTNLCETCAAESTGTLGESEIFWSPDGKRLAFTVHDGAVDEEGEAPCKVFLVRTDPREGSTLTQFTFPDSGLHDYDPSWSPLGFEIAFDRDDRRILRKGIPGVAADTALHLVTASGGPFIPGDITPSISPDGQWVAFSRRDGGPRHLYKVPIGGGTPTQLTSETDGVDFYPQWSPDGQWITYDRQSGASDQPHRAYKVSAGGGSPVAVFDPPTGKDAATPAYSPDGAILVFGFGTHDTGPNPPVDVTTRTLDPSTASPHPIPNYDDPMFAVHGPDPVLSPRLSPDGTRLALHANQIWAVRPNMSLPPQFTSTTATGNGTRSMADSTVVVDYTFELFGNSTLAVLASDPEGDALTYHADFRQSWMTWNPATRTLTLNPPGSANMKTFFVRFSVTTESGGTDSFIARILVRNTSPGGPSVAHPMLQDGPTLEGPNPTRGSFALVTPQVPGATAVLTIYDLSGRQVALIRGSAGSRLVWDGRMPTGRPAPGGVYLYHLDVARARMDGKLVLLR